MYHYLGNGKELRFEIWDDNALEQAQPLIKKLALNSQVCGNGYSNIYGPQKLLQQLCSTGQWS